MGNSRNREIREQLDILKEKFGGVCWIINCNVIDKLQFAHIKDTGLNGRGRGRKERYYDIKNHLNCYALLCEDHHEAYDAGTLPETEFLEIDRFEGYRDVTG